jgi:hypothetical protein
MAIDRDVREHAEDVAESYRLIEKAERSDRTAQEVVLSLLKRLRVAQKAIESVRSRWPHIEIPASAERQAAGTRREDPGSPACLRCTIEETLR